MNGPQITDLCCEILMHTHDGDELAPEDLSLLQWGANGQLNDKGIEALQKLHAQVMAGEYQKPYHLGVEFMTYDHEGYVYFKGHEVEHYSQSWAYSLEAKASLQRLQQVCLFLEQQGEKIGPYSERLCDWKSGEKYAEAFAEERKKELDRLCDARTIRFTRIQVTASAYFLLPGHPSPSEITGSDYFSDLVDHYRVSRSEPFTCEFFTYSKKPGAVRPATETELAVAQCCVDYLKETRQIKYREVHFDPMLAIQESEEDWER